MVALNEWCHAEALNVHDEEDDEKDDDQNNDENNETAGSKKNTNEEHETGDKHEPVQHMVRPTQAERGLS